MNKISSISSLKEFENYLVSNEKVYDRLRTTVFGIITSEISKSGVTLLPIQSRLKDKDSALSKIKRKGYTNPVSEMTDIVAFRLNVYLESDIEKVEKILRNCFEIDNTNSINKRNPEKVDLVGYRSLHLVCRLGSHRIKLPEYSEICELPFEVQVRTALEHTWAEIEHKQNYKSRISLPEPLQRRLNIISGALELVDRELSSIAEEADDYKLKISEDIEQIGADRLSTTSLHEIAKKVTQSQSIKLDPLPKGVDISELVNELSDFGVITVSDFQNLANSVSKKYLNMQGPQTIYGYV